jgi:small ligand-binding sensory domain FIST
MVMATRAHAGALEDIAGTVSAVLHPLVVMGSAVESAVGTGREVGGTPALSLWAGRVGPLARVVLRATRLADDSWHFAGWPERLGFEPTALVLLADPFTFPAGEFLQWLDGVQPGLPVVGGTASGGRGPGGSRLLVGDRVVTTGAVGVLIGPGVDLRTVVSQGCRGYGDSLTVTRSDRNVIHEVAGVPAMECMVGQIRDNLEPDDIAGMESNGLFLGRLIDEHLVEPESGDFLIRNVVGVDRSTGAVAVDDRVPLGSTVRFHLRDDRTAHHELDHLLQGQRADAAMLFNCNGRGAEFFDMAHHDAMAMQRAFGPVPLGGCTTTGEIGPVGGQNFVHAFSATMALFRDR